MTAQTGDIRPTGRFGLSHRARRLLWIYAVLAVPILVFVVFNIYPLLRLVDLAFRDWAKVVGRRPNEYVLDNFSRLATDPVFYKVVMNTAAFTIIRVLLGMTIGLIVALAIERTRAFRSLYVTAWFSPFMTSVVAMAILFTYFYNPTFGLFDYLLRSVGLPTQSFLSSPSQALFSIVVVDLWKTLGFNVVIFLAGLSGIPQDFYDAANVDGAGAFQRFRNVTLPLLARTTYLLLLINVIGALRVFIPVYMMTGFNLSSGGLGGPINSTNVITLFMYQAAFRFNDFGYAAAASTVLFLFAMILTVLQLRLLRVNWEY